MREKCASSPKKDTVGRRPAPPQPAVASFVSAVAAAGNEKERDFADCGVDNRF